uniref:Patellin-3 n=1 Tax=Rhizophora mucronata TaxID=61149 RepID=A0A2P2ILP9_RHIMU
MAEESSSPPAEQAPVTVPQPLAAEKGTEDLPQNVEEHSSPVVIREKSEEEPLPKESKSLAAIMEKEESLSPPAAALDENAKEKGKSLDTKEEVVAEESGKEKKEIEEKITIPQTLMSFKEESNKVADLSDSERKALEELKQLVQDGLDTRQFSSPPAPSTKEEEKQVSAEEGQKSKIEENPEKGSHDEATKEEPKAVSLPDEISIWGIPLLKDDRSDVILLKFLRARDFKVKDAFTMLKNTIQWRKDFGIDKLLNEDLGDDLEKVVFMHGHDKEGHPVCYNVYGEFQNKKLYDKTFSGEEKQMKFLRWRIQFLERSIRTLDFSPGGISTIFQVNDLKNSPGPGKRELRLATRQGLQLLQDNYPEFVAKQVFINVPWWYLAFYTMISPFLTQRTKSKFVFSGPSKYAETLFKLVTPISIYFALQFFVCFFYSSVSSWWLSLNSKFGIG